jgi:hypothetical protein
MIRNETEHRAALRRQSENREFVRAERAALETDGVPPEQIEALLEPAIAFHAQLDDEIAWYEDVRRRKISPVKTLTHLGRALVAARLAQGITQKQLAERLGVSEAMVSRDERNEYHGITLERAQRTLDAMDATVTALVDVPHEPGWAAV